MQVITMTLVASLGLGLSGCQTIKGLTGQGDDETVATATQSEANYYRDATEALEKQRYLQATTSLSELRTFFPTGRYAEQALLDLMYAQFQSKEYAAAVTSAEQFIRLYPNNPNIDYAYYVRGVANMQTASSALLNFAGLKQAHRDTSYLRLAFNNFQELVTRFPNSIYAPDAAQRMSYIYNQFAESELTAARWYIERQAYVAAANRAKWVFQFYPLSEQVPEAIAILAYSNEQLGLTKQAQEYKTLLQINYPEWLNSNGSVRLANTSGRSWLNKITFGRLGRSTDTEAGATGTYTGATKTQIIQQAAQLQLPNNNSAQAPSNQVSLPASNQLRNVQFGLGLPETDSEQITSQSSAAQAASDSIVQPDNAPAIRQTTTDADTSLPSVVINPQSSQQTEGASTQEAE
ncbi:outer membrane protein assembly factor BamD [Psychrobacter sp. I-STPA6b]|uniref:outer membrane protein assembly factor BamD n=1 Tax=Psychrobacter sp. I-STPA6b TaxID=2585718 RepID=UPI001D0C71C7